jgi:mannose-1-phosphate guanylyltransferase
MLQSQVSTEATGEFGELVADPLTKELLHFAEKPETHVLPNKI